MVVNIQNEVFFPSKSWRKWNIIKIIDNICKKVTFFKVNVKFINLLLKFKILDVKLKLKLLEVQNINSKIPLCSEFNLLSIDMIEC